ncbi:MAG TPA: hypothetical protein VIP77_06845 [Jiangellaceae bacterium]
MTGAMFAPFLVEVNSQVERAMRDTVARLSTGAAGAPVLLGAARWRAVRELRPVGGAAR